MKKKSAFAMGRCHALFKRLLLINWLYIMKINICSAMILTFNISLFASTSSSGQNIATTEVKICVQNETLKSVFRKLQDESGFNIFYSSAKVDVTKRVTIYQNGSVAEVLNQLLKETGLAYRQQGNSIVIFPQTTQKNEQQQLRLAGMVVDETGGPLPGVVVILKGSQSTSTATDVNGHFGLLINSENDVIVFTLIGHKSQEVVAKTIAAGIKIVMHPVSSSLNEVQVIGYGTTTRALNTGSVSSITAKDIGNQPVSNPLASMQGKLPGVQITQNNGLPGSGFRVQIRGIGSIGSGTLPLYVIDGVPFTLFNGSAAGSSPGMTTATDGLNAFGISGANGGETSPLGMINPDDIEQIDVLKDADATAIYGSKGANGVVLITTKKGKSGKTQFNLNVYQGTGKVAHFIDELSTADYLAMRRAAFAASGVTPTPTNAPDLLAWDQTANTNWQKKFIGNTANTTNADFSINGGNTQNTFLFSTNYRKEGTTYPGSFGANTFSNRLNAGHKSQDNRFGINMSANYAYQSNNIIGTDVSSFYNVPPNLPLYNADGSLYWNSSFTNPLAYLLRPNYNTTTNLLANMDVHYLLLPGLTLKANVGYSLTGLKQILETPLSSLNPTNVNLAAPTNSTRYANNTTSNYIIEPQAQYQRKIAKGILGVLVGGTVQRTLTDGLSLTGTGFSSDALLGSVYNAASLVNSGSNNSDYKYDAGFARVNYNWQNKYLLDATYRRDGSSRFGASHRFGNFWAVGAGWIFTEESWLKNTISWLSFGKLRGSYGLTGNDQITNYQYDAYFTSAGTAYSYQGQSIIYPSNIPNPDLHWETNKKLDMAFELGFLKDRIYLKTDYYLNRSSDQLLYLTIPTQAGINAYMANFPAVVQNNGFEFELSSTNVNSKCFKWVTTANVTFQKNQILSINDPSKLFYTYIIGQPVNGILLYHFTGINPANGAPTYQDMNGDGTISSASDRYAAPLGTPYYGGLNNSFTYKRCTLDISLLFNHRMGYINNSSFYPYGSGLINQNTSALKRWMTAGDNAIYPGANTVSSTAYNLYNTSDANWGDASFIKLKTINLSYSLPALWVKKIGFSNITLFGRGENIYTWAKQKYTLDPETTVTGGPPGLGTGQFIAMPQLRTLVVGLNSTF